MASVKENTESCQLIRTTSDTTHVTRSPSSRLLDKLQRISLLTFLALILTIDYSVADVKQTQRHLIGVKPDVRHLYDLEEGAKFRCLDQSKELLLSAVNDNYCDCMDASDEPGTSACFGGHFYCHNEGYIAMLIPASRVNDGICDCCDASDEYNGTNSCNNICDELGETYRREQERNRRMSEEGSAIRSQYKEQARLKREENQQLLAQYRRELSEKENLIKRLEEEYNADFGPSNVFFPLKGKCFNHIDNEYTYTLCPFDRAAQESAGNPTELGRWAGWAGPAENLYSRQNYADGTQCWNGPRRSVRVNIHCGVEDRILQVSEPAKCEYVYDFQTPAACPDLDPPEPPQESDPDQNVSTAPTQPLLEEEEDSASIQEPGEEDIANTDSELHDEL